MTWAMAMSRQSFGAFFKACRIKAGMTLREFCLRNGFDPGNLSRLERGLLPPPQAHDKLEEYASALGLKKGSDQWYEFFDLSAAEAGRIPKDLLSVATLIAAKPRPCRGCALPGLGRPRHPDEAIGIPST
jgi:transcriptional regulator with XRE-family HTH domain